MKKVKLGVCLIAMLLAAMAMVFRSDPVKGQTGGASLSAPTGLTASVNQYNSKIGLFWDTIRGATLYRIFRATTNNPTGATDVGTTPSNTFFDATAAAGQNLFYWVRAENVGNVSQLSASSQGRRATTANQGPQVQLAPPGAPLGNPVTATKIYLGKTLFWDEQMSSTRTVSCGTCHRAATGGADPRAPANQAASMNPGPDGLFNTDDDILGSAGVSSNNLSGTYNSIPSYKLQPQVTGRKAPSYINAGYPNVLFWDGRASATFRDPITNAVVLNAGAALESQVIGPPVNSGEMAHGGRNWLDVAARITESKPLALSANIPAPLVTWLEGRTYPELFQEAFGTADVTPARIAMAIATFERSLYSDRAPVDLDSQGIAPLTQQEVRGRNIFNSPANNCAVCHGGSRFTDNAFHNIGVRPDTEDPGHEQVTGFPNDRSTFRTPNLRNVELRGSYFHNGRFTTLEQVVDFYDRGGDFDANNRPNLIHPLELTPQQKADLVAFLKRPLTDPRVASETERFDHPELYTESNRVPAYTGAGRVGSGGFTPQIYALSPPLIGNPQFTVSVDGVLGNSPAVLVISEIDPGTGTTIPAAGSFARVTATTNNTGSGNGWASVTVPIPYDGTLVGRRFYARWYVTDAGAANGFSVSQAATFVFFGEASAPTRAAHVDFDGDGRTDISIFRPASGEWWYSRSSDGQTRALQFGSSTDTIVPADLTGDGKADVAIWRPSTGEWYVLRSEDNSFYSVPFGAAGDIPATGDFDGDGTSDITVFRPQDGTWFIQASTAGTLIRSFGINGDLPQIGDYDGDGIADLAIYRPSSGQWWINRSASGVIATQFGTSTDKPLAQDFSGDGKADVAFFRPATGEWYIVRSEDSSFYSVPFGQSTDIPAPGDYDGDGKADPAIFRPSTGTWYVERSTQGTMIFPFGSNGDQPAPGAYVRN